MSVTAAAVKDGRGTVEFSHEVVSFEGLPGLPPAVLPFLVEGIDRGEPVLVVMLPDRLGALRAALGPRADRIDWVDMGEVGGNPASIIPAWRSFVEAHIGGGPVRGIGEPLWFGRREAETAEAELHEALLNVAFDDGPGWRLLCPYDRTALPQRVLEEAVRNHPVRHAELAKVSYAGHEHARRAFSRPLPQPPRDADAQSFDGARLADVRDAVRRSGERVRLHPDTIDGLVLAAHEVAANSVQHGGGGGAMLTWEEPGALVVEVRDLGVIDDVLVGRGTADLGSEHGRGIWMANQLCDLVQVRSGSHGTQVRLYTWL